MNKLYIVIIALCFCFGAFSTTARVEKEKNIKKECVLEDLATSGLGDVKYSILSEAQFQAINGDEWVLMKGQSKTTLGVGANEPSVFDYFDLAQNTSTTNLPDGRGIFFRGKNNATGNTATDRSDGFQDPDGEKKIGELSIDKFKSHNHASQVSSDRIGNPDGSSDTSGSSSANNSYWRGNKYLNANTTPTTYAGGNETAPKSLTINIFVKVKRKCLDAVALAERRAAEARITNLEGYILKNTCDVCLGMPESTLVEQRAKNVCTKAEIGKFEANTVDWSVTCQARTISSNKKVLMLIGAANRDQAENDWLSHLDNQYPYYNVVEQKK